MVKSCTYHLSYSDQIEKFFLTFNYDMCYLVRKISSFLRESKFTSDIFLKVWLSFHKLIGILKPKSSELE